MAHPFLQEIFNDPMAYVIHAECSKLSDMAEKAAQCLHLYMYVYPYSSELLAPTVTSLPMQSMKIDKKNWHINLSSCHRFPSISISINCIGRVILHVGPVKLLN